MLYLKKLSEENGINVYEYLKVMPLEENGFYNPAKEENLINYEAYKNWVIEKIKEEKGLNIKEGRVPQTIYLVMENGVIIGLGKIRHYLNEALLINGGHIGLAIKEEYRKNGNGIKALKLLLEECKNSYNIENVLVTIEEENIPSIKMTERNGGKLEKISNNHAYYWIKL